jgi:PAS domain S-box-containing protein
MPFTTSLEQGVELFRHLFEEASLGIAVEDLDGKLLLANPALCSMLGYSEEDLCAMSCSQFARPEDEEEDWAQFQKLRAGLIDHYSLEKGYVRKDGARIWGRLNVSLFKNSEGGTPLVFAFVEEVTERKRVENSLRESEERLRLATQTGRMYAYEWDVATDEVVRSSEYMNVLGLTDAPRRLSRQELLEKVHPDDRAKFIAAITDLTPQNPDSHLTYRVLLPSGDVTWLEKRARAFFDEERRMLRMIGMVADVTERKRAEEALRESEESSATFSGAQEWAWL